jgi:hypothetical protein
MSHIGNAALETDFLSLLTKADRGKKSRMLNSLIVYVNAKF